METDPALCVKSDTHTVDQHRGRTDETVKMQPCVAQGASGSRGWGGVRLNLHSDVWNPQSHAVPCSAVARLPQARNLPLNPQHRSPGRVIPHPQPAACFPDRKVPPWPTWDTPPCVANHVTRFPGGSLVIQSGQFVNETETMVRNQISVTGGGGHAIQKVPSHQGRLMRDT